MTEKNEHETHESENTPRDSLHIEPPRHGAAWRIRNYFLTGIIVAAPISITVYLSWSIINLIDGWVKPLIPSQYNPDTYLHFSLPGFGLLVAGFGLIMLGFLTANFFGRAIVSYGEGLLDRMPLIRSVYKLMKQIFETVLSQSGTSFREAVLVEYPRRGIWALAFVSTETKGEIALKTGNVEDMVSVFLPTTPNPTSGFLLFVPRTDVISLDMTVEDAAKLVISAGLVVPEHKLPAPAKEKIRKARELQPADNS